MGLGVLLIQLDVADILGLRRFLFPPDVPVIRETREIVFERAGIWQEVFSKARESLVHVQIFRGGKLWQKGNALVLTDDGVLLTALGQGALMPSDKIILYYAEEKIVADSFLNMRKEGISFLRVAKLPAKTHAVSFPPSDAIAIAQEGLLITADEKKYVVTRGLVMALDEQGFTLDTFPRSQFFGGGFFNAEGKLLGLVRAQTDSEIELYDSTILLTFLQRYLSRNATAR